MIISVNKMIEKGAEGIKGYLRLRTVVQTKHLGSSQFLLILFGGSLDGFRFGPGLLGSFMVIFLVPKFRFSL